MSRSVLRPNDMTPGVRCSIHCGSASGPPALSCFSCQSLFHPVCVGLMEGPDYNGFDFYCADCSPPPGKENVQMPPPLLPPLQHAPRHNAFNGDDAGNDLGNPKSPQAALVQSRRPNPAPRLQHTEQQQQQHQPLKPIEVQAFINVAGKKYLVVPMDARAEDRHQFRIKGGEQQPGPPPLKRLPLMLRPSGEEGSSLPSFEVEETADGKLLLIPTTVDGKQTSFKKQPEKGRGKTNWASDLSGAYFAILKVFGYLNPKQRLEAAKVCRLWRDLALHHSLWNTVSLRVR